MAEEMLAIEKGLEKTIENATRSLKLLRARRKRLSEDDPEPHEEKDEDEKPAAPQKKRKKRVLEGPCDGKIWLDPASKCAEDADTFVGARFNGKNRMLCVSCKKEYTKWRKLNK